VTFALVLCARLCTKSLLRVHAAALLPVPAGVWVQRYVDDELRVMNTPSIFVLRKRAGYNDAPAESTTEQPNVSIQRVIQDFKGLPDDLNSVDANEYVSAMKAFNTEAFFGTFVLLDSVLAIPSLFHGGIPGNTLEAFSSLFVFLFVAVSAGTKLKTGDGLPAGPGGILGGAEGVAYLACLGTIVSFIASRSQL